MNRPSVAMAGMWPTEVVRATSLLETPTARVTFLVRPNYRDHRAGQHQRRTWASGNRPSFWPILSPDGSILVFGSHASNLIRSDYNEATDNFWSPFHWTVNPIPSPRNFP